MRRKELKMIKIFFCNDEEEKEKEKEINGKYLACLEYKNLNIVHINEVKIYITKEI